MNKKKGLFVFSFFVVFMLLQGVPTVASEYVKEEISLQDPILVHTDEKASIAGKGGNDNDETPGEWYAGETPENLLADAPVLLFVPGLNNTAQIFWEDNDMYQTAHDAGYQTAFVQLYDAGGESADMWDNGELLAEKITEISNHFDGKPITIVAYSKGGVDAQTALTYYGASEYVENVITLSSPHHGSQLADLAYSFWAGWLADLIGMQGEGTYAMETGYMDNFRTEIEGEPLAYHNDYYTLGGTDWGSIFSSTWFGGTYLSSYGDNDGVVTTASSNLPGGHELEIGEWNHSTIRTGETFDVFQNYIRDYQLTSLLDKKDQAKQVEQPDFTGNQWIHGGALLADEAKQIAIPVEENVRKLSIDIMTAAPVVIKMTDTNGNEADLSVQSSKSVEGIFQGAVRNSINLDDPKTGTWTVELQSNENNGYLLMADYETDDKLKLNHGRANNQAETYQLTVNKSNVQEASLRATYHIVESGNPENVKILSVRGNADLSQALVFDKKNTVYNVTIDIAGVTKSGNPFKRSIVDSIYKK